MLTISLDFLGWPGYPVVALVGNVPNGVIFDRRERNSAEMSRAGQGGGYVNTDDKTLDTPPAEYVVVVLSAPVKELGGKRVWGRVANCHSVEVAHKLIEFDIKSARETFGGLLAPTPTKGREYAIWRATWERVK